MSNSGWMFPHDRSFVDEKVSGAKGVYGHIVAQSCTGGHEL